MVTALPSLCPVSVLVKTVTKDVEGLLDCLAWLLCWLSGCEDSIRRWLVGCGCGKSDTNKARHRKLVE